MDVDHESAPKRKKAKKNQSEDVAEPVQPAPVAPQEKRSTKSVMKEKVNANDEETPWSWSTLIGSFKVEHPPTFSKDGRCV